MSAKRRAKVPTEAVPASKVVALRAGDGAAQPDLAPGAHFARLEARLEEGRYQAKLMTGERLSVGLAPEVDAELADQCLSETTVVLVGLLGTEAVVFGALRTKASKAEELLLEAPKRLVLRAGKAKLVLTADGKVKLSGSDVTIDAPREVRLASARVEIP